MRRQAPTVLAVFVAVLVMAATAVATTPVKLKDTRADESYPTIADGWLAWSANTTTHPKDWKGYAQPDGGAVRKIPVQGHVWIGSIADVGPRAGQVSFTADATGNGDIGLYDLASKAVLKAPRGVNTAKRETTSSMQGDYLAFSRYISDSRVDVLLYAFSTGKVSTVASGWYFATQVNGEFLTYQSCRTDTCNAWRYSITKGKALKLPAAPTGRANYFPAVQSDGVTFWVQGSNTSCGKNTKILRRANNGNITTIWAVPDGTEISSLEARTVGASPVLVLTEIDCASNDTGIYELPL